MDAGTRQHDPFPFFHQIAQMLLIPARIGRPRHVGHPLAYLLADRVSWLSASIPIYQSGSALLAIRCQYPPHLARRERKKRSRFLHREVGTQEPIEDQDSFLFLGVPCHGLLHQWTFSLNTSP